MPDVIIGDFDSVNADTLNFFKKKNDIEWTKLNLMKDDTDTEAAIRLATVSYTHLDVYKRQSYACPRCNHNE